MSSLFESLILGVVQGLTEFIPVSSSGHLVVVPYLLGFETRGLDFDVALHVGTLLAVLVYFRAELWAIARGLLGVDRSADARIYRRVGLFIIPASVPVSLAGFLLRAPVSDMFERPLAVAAFLLLTAMLLVAGESWRARRVRQARTVTDRVLVTAGHAAASELPRVWRGDWRAGPPLERVPSRPRGGLPIGEDGADPRGASLAALTLGQALLAGLFQALALLPGVSRSGATIVGALFGGLTREAATRFSFLLAIPALLGATVVSLPDLLDGSEALADLTVGVVAAFVSGYLAIRYLVALVSRDRLTGFAIYCVALALLTFFASTMLGPPSSV